MPSCSKGVPASADNSVCIVLAVEHFTASLYITIYLYNFVIVAAGRHVVASCLSPALAAAATAQLTGDTIGCESS